MSTVTLPAHTANNQVWLDEKADLWEATDAEPAVLAMEATINRPRMQPHVVTPIPETLARHVLQGDICAVAPPALAGCVGMRTQTLTAVICAAVIQAPQGYSAAEMIRALRDVGVDIPRMHDVVKGALASQAQEGHLNRHLEVVQERGPGHTNDILRTVTIYTKPKAPGAFEAYGGFRHADCPKCFRGDIIPELILPAAVNDFVRRITGPIIATPVYKRMQDIAYEWTYGAKIGEDMAERCRRARRPTQPDRTHAFL